MAARRVLLTATTVIEAPLGVLLLLSPGLVAGLLLRDSLDPLAASVVGRVAGAAVLSLAVACWLARDDHASGAGRGLVAALLVYNVLAAAALAHAGLGLRLGGLLLGLAVALHVLLAVWCVACVRSGPATAAARPRE